MNKNCPIIVTATGFFLLLLGIMCSWYAFPKLVEYLINERIALKEGTQAYSEWKKQSFPLKFKIYFFNVTNTREVQNGAKPILKEMGPYIYDEYREKTNVVIDEEADTITYLLKKTYFFNQKESGCRTDEDSITMLNAGLVGIALQVDEMMPSAMSMVTDAIPYLYPGAYDIFLRTKVKDILFDGILIHCTAPEIELICGGMKGALPPTMKVAENGQDFIFSMFGHLNGTDDGPYVMGRGLKNETRGEIMGWKGMTQLTHWNNKYCNTINGSDSTVFYRMSKPADKLYSFAQDFCRSMYASFEEETTYRGIHVYKYVSKKESIQNSPENECFCPVTKDEEGNDIPVCPTNGLINIKACVDAPILVSYPHFYLADESLLDYAIGLKPDPEIHGSFAYFEPTTATPLSGMKRVQMNIKIKNIPAFDLLANVTDGVFPMIWLEEGVDIPEDIFNLLESNFSKLKFLDIFKWMLTGSGILLMISSFILVLQKENLMCFSKVANMEVPKRVQNINITTISNSHNSSQYPNLYPQSDNKNVHDNLKRPNIVNQESWDFKL